MSLSFVLSVKEIFKGVNIMMCELCSSTIPRSARFCGYRCKTIVRLRKMATKSLLEYEEKSFGEGYDSVVKRAWIKHKLDEISNGKQDCEMFRMFLARRG